MSVPSRGIENDSVNLAGAQLVKCEYFCHHFCSTPLRIALVIGACGAPSSTNTLRAGAEIAQQCS